TRPHEPEGEHAVGERPRRQHPRTRRRVVVRPAQVIAAEEVVRCAVVPSARELHQEKASPEDQGEQVEEAHGTRSGSIHGAPKRGLVRPPWRTRLSSREVAQPQLQPEVTRPKSCASPKRPPCCRVKVSWAWDPAWELRWLPRHR